jgi:hypothetical protein
VYPPGVFLALFIKWLLSNKPNGAENLVAIGMQIANYGIDPEETANVPLDAVLEHWNEHMYANIHGADIGTIIAQKIETNYYRVTHQTVWPDDLLYGLAYGFARGRLPKGTPIEVWYEDLSHRLDADGSDKTVICVRWR